MSNDLTAVAVSQPAEKAYSMLMFLASVLEQLDLAHDHVIEPDVHNARFGLMLTDNAVELVLHQIAKDKSSELGIFLHLRESYPHESALNKALGRAFEEKVKFARIEGCLDDEQARTINIMHNFRNEVYHVGIQHEAILPSIASFYFDVACGFIGSFKPRGLGWGSNMQLPERSKRFFNGDGFMPGRMDDFHQGCRSLADSCEHSPVETVSALAEHMEQVINEQDICIGIVADGVYEGQQTTRDRAVLETQAWSLAFTDEGKSLAEEQEWNGNLLDWVSWLTENQPFRFKSDPVESWRKQLANLRSRKNPHEALSHYYSFMLETEKFREAMEESARQAEAEIETAMDRMRGR